MTRLALWTLVIFGLILGVDFVARGIDFDALKNPFGVKPSTPRPVPGPRPIDPPMPAPSLRPQPDPEPAQPIGTLEGKWKEYWGKPGETDVDYHDLYVIGRDKSGQMYVRILDRNQEIDEVKVEGRTIRFRQKTSFEVRYALTLDRDGRWLRGTATTPNRTFEVKWERLADDSAEPAPPAPAPPAPEPPPAS